MVEKMSKIPHDKLLHSFYGMIIYIVGCLVSPLVGIGLVVVAAIGKELADYPRWDLLDVVATLALPFGMYLVMAIC